MCNILVINWTVCCSFDYMWCELQLLSTNGMFHPVQLQWHSLFIDAIKPMLHKRFNFSRFKDMNGCVYVLTTVCYEDQREDLVAAHVGGNHVGRKEWKDERKRTTWTLDGGNEKCSSVYQKCQLKHYNLRNIVVQSIMWKVHPMECLTTSGVQLKWHIYDVSQMSLNVSLLNSTIIHLGSI